MKNRLRVGLALLVALAVSVPLGATAFAVDEGPPRTFDVELELGCRLADTATGGYFDGGQKAYIEFVLTITNDADLRLDTNVLGGYHASMRAGGTTHITVPAGDPEAEAGVLFTIVVNGEWSDNVTAAVPASAVYDGSCVVPAPVVTSSASVPAVAAAAPVGAKFTG